MRPPDARLRRLYCWGGQFKIGTPDARTAGAKRTVNDLSKTTCYRCFAFGGTDDSVFNIGVPKGIQLRGLRFKDESGLNAGAITHSTTGGLSILFFM